MPDARALGVHVPSKTQVRRMFGFSRAAATRVPPLPALPLPLIPVPERRRIVAVIDAGALVVYVSLEDVVRRTHLSA